MKCYTLHFRSVARLSSALLLIVLATTINAFAQPKNREAALAYNKALAHYNAQNYQFAIPYLAEAVTHDPSFEAAFHLLAVSFDETNDTRNAILNYEKVLQLNPNQEKVWYNLSHLYVDNQQTAKAIQALEKAVKIAPDYAKAHQRLGVLYAQSGDGDKAGEHYGEATKGGMTVPALSEATAYYKKGDYTNALKKADEAIKASDDAKAHYVKGLALSRLDRSDDAVEAFSKATQKDADYTSAWIEMGILQYNEEQFQGASNAFSKAVQLKPDDSELQAFYGRALVSSGQHSKAISPLQSAVAEDPNNAELTYFLAEALEKGGKGTDAQALYAKAESMGYKGKKGSGGQQTKFYNAGIQAYRNGDYREAASQFKSAIKEDPKVAKYHYNLGLSLKKNRMPDDAKN
ncbi:MAG: tetratricopeptide repeat protein, partial [Bacteroidota bacterium]